MSKRKKTSNPFSLLSFQDIIMSVSGIFIFLTLLLALDLVSRVIGAVSQDVPPQKSMEKIQEEIQALEKQIQQIQKEVDSQLEVQQSFLDFNETEVKENFESLKTRNAALAKEIETLKKEKEELDLQAQNIPTQQKKIEEINKEIEKIENRKKQIEEMVEDIGQKKSNVFVRNGNHRETPWLVDIYRSGITIISLKDIRTQTFSGVKNFLDWSKKCDPRREYFMLYVRPSASSSYEDIQKSLKKSGFKIGVDLLGEQEKIIVADGEKQ